MGFKGEVDYCTGFGISANSLADVDRIINLCNKHGYVKAQKLWWERTKVGSGYSFGFLKGAEARKYAKDEDAYGDYAKKLRGKFSKGLP